MLEATEIDGVWMPWRHPDFNDAGHPLQGWWRHQGSGEHIAVLADAGPSSAGNALVLASYYNADAVRRGNGTRIRADRITRDFDRMPPDFDPRR